ncbi:retrovirus-related Pol polyprotein from transposon 17.6 [Trichonephila clavipes]|nr:retrovirus-related Pol polyprotein from transposon 17.6 [Trichonephila clavipes]
MGHEGTSGHLGVTKPKNRIARYFYWHQCYKEIEELVKTCDPCQRAGETPGRDPRPCIDYRKLNEVIRTQFYPLPNIEHRIETVAAAKYITLLDLTKGYWQILLTPKAQRLAAILELIVHYVCHSGVAPRPDKPDPDRGGKF